VIDAHPKPLRKLIDLFNDVTQIINVFVMVVTDAVLEIYECSAPSRLLTEYLNELVSKLS
jgi:hypothetical protein